MSRLRLLWEFLRSSFWFTPSTMVAGAALAAGVLLVVDAHWGPQAAALAPWLLFATAEGARGVLSTIATSMITVAGVAFSITLVALSLASSQYSPRVLRNFMRDRGIQLVLGTFVAVYAYCLVALRGVRVSDGLAPVLTVFTALVLAFVGVGFLIYFIHHVATTIQASSIIQAAAMETIGAIERLFPEDVGRDLEVEAPDAVFESQWTWHPLRAAGEGYIQNIDPRRLMDFAARYETVVRMERGMGSFVVRGAVLASLADRVPDESMTREFNSIYTLNHQRTVEQDATFGIRQMVDVALKALSPGVNDTTTAIICIDYLTAVLSRLAQRRIVSRYRTDNGQLRVIAVGPTFRRVVDEALNQIRQVAGSNVSVLVRLLKCLKTVETFTNNPQRRAVVRQHADLVIEQARRGIPCRRDLQHVETSWQQLADRLADAAPPG